MFRKYLNDYSSSSRLSSAVRGDACMKYMFRQAAAAISFSLIAPTLQGISKPNWGTR